MSAPDANDLASAGKPLISDGEPIMPLPEERPTIVITTDEADVNDLAVRALAQDPSIYVRRNELVRILDGSSDEVETTRAPVPPSIATVPIETLQERLARSARFVTMKPKKGKDGEVSDWFEVPQHPPRWCVGAVAKRGAWPGLRHLEAVTEQPTLRPNGTVLDTPGYDRASGVFLYGSSKPFLAVPSRPTAADVSAALELLNDTVIDVCWEMTAHRSSWLASVLTPLARHAFGGPAPLFLFDAPTAGTGKSLCAEIAIRIATGRSAPASSFTDKDEEMDKRVLAWALSGAPTVMLDNVGAGKALGGDSLCRVLTSTIYESRWLGSTETRSSLALMVWYATGNNVALGRDMHRRIAHARILSPVEDPAKRTGFKYPRLKEHVARTQRELCRAALTILRAYCEAGRPDQSLPTWGSYEEWSALVRGAIVWVGWEDPQTTVDALRDAGDDTLPMHRALGLGWAQMLGQMGRDACTVKEALEHLYRSDPGPLPTLRSLIDERASKDGKPSIRALGNHLKSMSGGVFTTDGGSLSVKRDGQDRSGSARWAIHWHMGGASAGSAESAGSVSAPPTRARKDQPSLLGLFQQGVDQTQQTQQTQQDDPWKLENGEDWG